MCGCSDMNGAEMMSMKKVLVVMGATGSGKSRLSIDLADHFSGVEIINADSMQVYCGLDVLTNKVSLSERKGVPHYLLGTIDASIEFTSKDFRDTAIPIIEDILSRGGLPVVVGGTNYYIQALMSPFLVDDVVEDMPERAGNSLLGDIDLNNISSTSAFEILKDIDPIAANRIHPNDHRKIHRYLSVYASSGVLPSSLFYGNHAEKWGRADNFRFNCCFIWVDASLSVLDRYVDIRVDSMIDAGLLNEVSDIYKPKSDYTRGMKQAIGIREFEEFFRAYSLNNEALYNSSEWCGNVDNPNSISISNTTKASISEILHSKDSALQSLLVEAIDNFKANTRKLVRRQKRRLNRLKTDFGWNMKYIDATKAFFDEAGDSWSAWVLQPCVDIVREFLHGAESLTSNEASDDALGQRLVARDLCTQYVCEACGNRILRGKHEWEQHIKGRVHRKRFIHFKKHLMHSADER